MSNQAGKGDLNRTTDHKAYRAGRLWWRSKCCKHKVRAAQGKRHGIYICLKCGQGCTIDPESKR